MIDNIFDGLDEDRETELRGEKAKKEFDPFSPALLADVAIGKNYHGNNCLSIILVRPHAVGNYYVYDFEIKDKKSIEELKLKKDDEDAKRKLTKTNMDMRAINIHLYDLPGTERTQPTAHALNYLQKVLTEKTLEVDVNFTSKANGTFTNHFFKDIKSLNCTNSPINQKVIELIKEDIDKRRELQALKRKIEKPDQYTTEIVEQKPVEDDDIPF